MLPGSGLPSLCQTLTEHAPTPMVALEGDTHIVRYVNPAFCRLLDKAAAQLDGKTCAEIMPKMDVFLTRLHRVYRTAKSETHNEAQYEKPHPVFWTYTIWPMLVDGNAAGVMVQVTESAPIHAEMVAVNEALVLGSLRQHELAETAENLNTQLRTEMDERRTAETAFRESETRYRTLFELSPVAVYSCDASGQIEKFNRMAALLWGREPLVSEGGERFCGSHKLYLPGGRLVPPELCPMGDVLNGKVAEVRDAEMLLERPDGSQVDCIVNIRSLRDEHGVVTGAINCFYDISARKQTEKALRESEISYRSLFNGIDEGFWVVEVIFDKHGKPVDWRFLEANPSVVKQTGLQEVVGKRLREAVEIVEEYWIELYGRVALTGEPVRIEKESAALKRWFDVYLFRIGEPAQRRVAVIFNNITARKRSEAALIELDHRKDEFLAMLSHELRNPLAPILHAVHLLGLQKDEDLIQNQARGIIERQVGQMTRLIDDLMEVSRLTTGRISLHLERMELNQVVNNAVETVNPLITRQRLAIMLNLSAEPIWLYADAARVEQVIVNVLTNAVKYTIEGGSIWLTLSSEGEEAVLRVRDTGIGIAPELLPHIFDLFTQGERSLDRSQGGLGIGLCLVQRLVEMHAGTVTVESTLGEGSEFVIRLPITHVATPVLPPATVVAAANGLALRVLVVEDNADAAETLKLVLNALGHDVQTAHDGFAAIDRALEFLPQIVLMDIGLPGLNGFEVAKRLRQQPTLAHVVLVAMTGYGEGAARQRSKEAGFNHHLVKPADFAKLQAILTSVSADSRR